MKKYTETHEWIEVNGNAATVGITSFAQKELGDIVYVELPKVGAHVKKGEEAAVLESTKAAADVYSPISGTITTVNTVLGEKPELINSSAEQEGWLFKLSIKDTKELDGLMDQDEYLVKQQ